jgi:hypothetical protein
MTILSVSPMNIEKWLAKIDTLYIDSEKIVVWV